VKYKGTERRATERRRDTKSFRTRPKREKRAEKGDAKMEKMYGKLDL